jgi:hypothetical protein
MKSAVVPPQLGEVAPVLALLARLEKVLYRARVVRTAPVVLDLLLIVFTHRHALPTRTLNPNAFMCIRFSCSVVMRQYAVFQHCCVSLHT